MVQVVEYCHCGGSLKGRVLPALAYELRRLWDEDHRGERCAPTNAQGAATARLLARLRERNRWRRAA